MPVLLPRPSQVFGSAIQQAGPQSHGPMHTGRLRSTGKALGAAPRLPPASGQCLPPTATSKPTLPADHLCLDVPPGRRPCRAPHLLLGHRRLHAGEATRSPSLAATHPRPLGCAHVAWSPWPVPTPAVSLLASCPSPTPLLSQSPLGQGHSPTALVPSAMPLPTLPAPAWACAPTPHPPPNPSLPQQASYWVTCQLQLIHTWPHHSGVQGGCISKTWVWGVVGGSGQPQPRLCLNEHPRELAGRAGSPQAHQSTSCPHIQWPLGVQAWGEGAAVLGPTWRSANRNPECRDPTSEHPGLAEAAQRNPSPTRPLILTFPKQGLLFLTVTDTHLNAGRRKVRAGPGRGCAAPRSWPVARPTWPTPAWNPGDLCQPVQSQIWAGGPGRAATGQGLGVASGQERQASATAGWPRRAGTEPQPRAPVTGGPAGPEPGWVCLGRRDASGSRPSSYPAPPHSTSRNRAWCNSGWPLLRAAGRWGSGHGAPAPLFRASGSLLHQVHCSVQGQLVGARPLPTRLHGGRPTAGQPCPESMPQPPAGATSSGQGTQGWRVVTPHPLSASPQLPLLLFVLHGEPNMLTKQETAPRGGGHGHGHTPGPAGPGAYLPVPGLAALAPSCPPALTDTQHGTSYQGAAGTKATATSA